MFHGNQRKIYHIRNVGGKFFDEAYLILRDGGRAEKESEPKDLAAEADRIIREAEADVRRHRLPSGGVKRALLFMFGVLLASAVTSVVVLLAEGLLAKM